ncbi:hypothetical protein PPTS312_44400 [Pseudomonas putida]|uniref:Uncharacterized protein n=1 Tax=Pseudomonas putida TaxID=303 RepID=A0A7U6M5U1_PSEPU|nr:hypothetical protein PPTS312_44400 [Pseudomonas putida]
MTYGTAVVNRAQVYLVSALWASILTPARTACSAASQKMRRSELIERDEPAIDEI